jgi:hypothetical protein
MSVWTTCALPTRTRVPILNHSRLALRRCDETSCPSMRTCVRQRCQRLTRSGRLVPLIPARRKKNTSSYAFPRYAVEMNFSQSFHLATRTKHLTGGPFCNLRPSYTLARMQRSLRTAVKQRTLPFRAPLCGQVQSQRPTHVSVKISEWHPVATQAP